MIYQLDIMLWILVHILLKTQVIIEALVGRSFLLL